MIFVPLSLSLLFLSAFVAFVSFTFRALALKRTPNRYAPPSDWLIGSQRRATGAQERAAERGKEASSGGGGGAIMAAREHWLTCSGPRRHLRVACCVLHSSDSADSTTTAESADSDEWTNFRF